MERTCSMFGCYNKYDDSSQIEFFQFPKNFNSCMLWVQNCGRPELFEDFVYGGARPFLSKTVCSYHFNSSDFTDPDCISRGLKSDATPILRYESDLVVKQEFEQDQAEYFDGNEEEQACIKAEPLESQYDFNSSESELDKRLEERYLELLVVSNDKVPDMGSATMFSQEAFKLAWQQALESADQREVRIEANALNNASKRANETVEERTIRNQTNAVRNANRRANETWEQRRERLYKNAVRAALRRSMESEEEQKVRRQKNALRAAYRRSNETEEQRAARRLKDKLRSAQRRKKETELQAKIRKYNDAVRAAFRRSNESLEQREQRRIYDVIRAAKRRNNETDEQRQKRLQADRERAAKRRSLRKLDQDVGILRDSFFHHDLAPYLEYNDNGTNVTDNSRNITLTGQPGCVNKNLDNVVETYSHANISQSEKNRPEIVWCT